MIPLILTDLNPMNDTPIYTVHGHSSYKIDFQTDLNAKEKNYQTHFFTTLVSEKNK